jgi:uncharacterized membrane protein YfcA
MLFVAAILALLIGIALGMLGGGGGILTLPMLVYAVHVEPKTAIATSLVVVGSTSLVGMSVHARQGAVRWRIGVTFSAASMTGAYVGGRLAKYVPSQMLLVIFGIVMLTSATLMLRARPQAENTAVVSPSTPTLLALGGAVGLLSGLVGAGGGFLIVPALSLIGGLPMRHAIGTSLFIIGVQSFAGFLGHAAHVHLDWRLVVSITSACVMGSLLGARIGRSIPAAKLRRAFAWLVITMGLFLFAKELPAAVALGVTLVVLPVAVFVGRTSSPPSAS